MIEGVISVEANSAMLAAAIVDWEAQGGTPPAPTSQIRLFTNDLTPNAGNPVDQFEEPTGAWYVPTAHIADFGDVFQDASGNVYAATRSTQFDFNPAGPVGPYTIYGAFVCASDGVAWYAAARFATPIILASVNDSCVVDPIRVRLPAGG